jgi:phytoene dehydrogenase-like protein
LRTDLAGTLMMGSPAEIVRSLPAVLPLLPYFRETMQQFGQRFKDPFLQRAFPLLEYSNPALPVFLHLMKHAYGLQRDIAWPAGGSLAFAAAIAKRYAELGGELHCARKVTRILTENNRAAGVMFTDGSEQRADIIISDADGRKTIMELLEGKYANDRIRAYCAEPPDKTDFAVQAFFGVNRDLSKEPSSLVLLLDRPVSIAGQEHHSVELQAYGFDPTLAPAGKGVIKVELPSRYSFWKALYADRPRYLEEKQKLSEIVLGLLGNYFPGIRSRVEATDVSTIMTWERYMGGTHGFANAPARKPSIIGNFLGLGRQTGLPGLDNFHFVGTWMTSTGALFSNAFSGKTVIKTLCKKEGKQFSTGKDDLE